MEPTTNFLTKYDKQKVKENTKYSCTFYIVFNFI